jgi:hypothetical protein
MSSRWSSPVVDTTVGHWQAVCQLGAVRLIATPWTDVQRRLLDEMSAVEADESLLQFDQVPLLADGRIVSIFVRNHGAVPVHSGMFMAADAPLLDFVESADRQGFRLLLHGSDVVGLVTLSDLQRLPVYSLLFSLSIAVEALLVEWIRRRCGEVNQDAWLDHLKDHDRCIIERHFERAVRANLAIDRLSCASLRQEIEAAIGLGLAPCGGQWHKSLDALVQLRDAVCHVQEFAGTPEKARALPTRVRESIDLANWLQRALIQQAP